MARKYTDKQKKNQDSRVKAFAATLNRRKGTEQQKKEAWELSAGLTKESADRLSKASQHRANMDRQCYGCQSAFADGAKVYVALDVVGDDRIGLLCEACRTLLVRLSPLSVGPLVETETAAVAEEDKQPEGDSKA